MTPNKFVIQRIMDGLYLAKDGEAWVRDPHLAADYPNRDRTILRPGEQYARIPAGRPVITEPVLQS